MTWPNTITHDWPIGKGQAALIAMDQDTKIMQLLYVSFFFHAALTPSLYHGCSQFKMEWNFNLSLSLFRCFVCSIWIKLIQFFVEKRKYINVYVRIRKEALLECVAFKVRIEERRQTKNSISRVQIEWQTFWWSAEVIEKKNHSFGRISFEMSVTLQKKKMLLFQHKKPFYRWQII